MVLDWKRFWETAIAEDFDLRYKMKIWRTAGKKLRGRRVCAPMAGMPHVMQQGGSYAGGVSGGVVKAVTNSGIVEKFIECVGVGGQVSFAANAAAGTLCYYNSQGKLNCGSTKDKNGGYRIDLQAVDGNPACANLQLQLNVKNLNPSTVACVRVPVGQVFTGNDVTAAFYASLTAVKNSAANKMAVMT